MNKKMTGARRRIITLRVRRSVYYRLSELAEHLGLSLEEYAYRILVQCAVGGAVPVAPADPEVQHED